MTARTAYRIALACMFTGLTVMVALVGGFVVWAFIMLIRGGYWLVVVSFIAVAMFLVGAFRAMDLAAQVAEEERNDAGT